MKNTAIAIVGMAGRFPGARNVAEFWQNLRDGVEAVRPFSDAQLLAAGVSADELAQPEYVKSGVVLEDLDKFDAAFFGFSPKDASIMDPQHRIFLECAWEALEDAGHAPASFDGSIGVYAGSGMNSYMIHNLLTNPRLVASAGLFLIRQTGNDKDVLATRVSYELDLRGPSISVQTACSTSLVAVHLACQSLLNQECDMALAGGVTVEFPHGRGYLYREGEILSRDGHCRAFDADSSGTVFSSGAGIAVLRRLEDALADRDTIHAVILGSAINNDGARKVGYLAPSVDGQSEVIAEALGVAGVAASDISYVETHGTGTKVGDPIEVKALTRAFHESTQGKGHCAIGSLKTNIGHLDAAAGIAGLIKTVLALRHRQIPPSLHFRKPNPLIDFENSPFYVNTGLTEWKAERGPRRAGVTSLGIGGTNAHVVLEEAPPVEKHAAAKKPYQLLVLSAKTASALEKASQNLGAHLQEHAELPLQDVACTLQLGREAFVHRRTIVVSTTEEAEKLLTKPEPTRVFSGQSAASAPGVVFMFSGQGSQYVNMGRELYETEAVFRAQLDRCAERLLPDLGLDLRTLLYPPKEDSAAAAQKLSHTGFTQPALFSVEYSLAQWWMAHGIAPSAMIGHSIGEYVAACVAGVLSLEDGLHLSAIRGRLMGEMPSGSMLAVAVAADTLALPAELELAAINGPEQCVVSGPTDAVQKFAAELERRAVPCRLLHTSHAFHSAMMDPMLESFRAHLAKVSLRAPKIPCISNVTGTWITAAEATDPGYWTKHLRNTVRFSGGLAELFRDPARVFLEVGPGQALASLTRQHPGRPKSSKVEASMRHPQEQISDALFLLNTTGQLWIAGVAIDWNALHAGEEPHRVSLPTYPFERQRYWIEPGSKALASKEAEAAPSAAAPSAEAVQSEQWFHRRVWKKSPAEKAVPAAHACWLLFLDETGLGREISKQLKTSGHEVLEVVVGDKYKRRGAGSYAIRPGERDDYDELLKDIVKREHAPTRILHLWPVTGATAGRSLDQALDLSFYSLLFLAQAWGDQDLGAVEIACVSNGLQSVSGENVVEPARAALLGPVRVIPKEFPGAFCRSIDLERNIQDRGRAASDIVAECSLRNADSCVAYRQSERWVETFESTSLRTQTSGTRLREKGVYLIVGGLGGIGLAVAEHLARTVHARLVLVSRAPLPPASEWQAVLDKPNGANGSRARQTIAKLREIESLGAEVLTISADVTDFQQITEALRTARQRFGDIHGVIHAAGSIEDAPLQIKTRESAARVLAPKIQGTLVLQQALGDSKLDFLLLFSSISSLAPPAGQVDYAAANAFLDAFALSQTGQPVTAVNWGMWADVGLAARDVAGSHPIVGRRLVQTATETVYSAWLSCGKNWLLSEHRFKNGAALIPGTGYLQLAAAALVQDKFEPGVDFEDVFFLAPLTVAPDETKEVRVRLRRQRSGFRFSILAKEDLAKDNEWTEYASGQIARNQKRIPADQNVAEIRGRCSSRRLDFDEKHRTRQEKYFDFGPRWRNLQSLHIGQCEALAELQLGQDFSSDVDTWPMHPALLDLATGSALYLIQGYEESEALYLPLSYKRITLYRPLPARFYSHIRCRQQNTTQREIATFSFTLLDGDGHILAEIDEFSLRRIATAADSPKPALRLRAPATDNEPVEVENPGMSSAEGINAFDRILSSDMPPGIIVARGGLPGKPAGPLVTAALSTSTAKPEGEIESVLAEWWRELLGVETVGLDDDFFDLGGHSLIAVRMFSKIKKTYEQDLNLSTLFEARTIRQLAALIRKAGTSIVPEVAPSSAVVAIRREGSRLPLFVVSGVGGHVIAFNGVTRYLGEDQPVFALQPQGLDGRAPFLTRVEDMAAYYVRALREVQPHGPYCLAGYSFGGFVVFEMAQQLHAAGETVSLLGLLDTIEWQYLERHRKSADLRQRFAMYKLRFRRVFLSENGLRPATNRAASVLTRKLYQLMYKLSLWSAPDVPDLQTINRIAGSEYRPTFYPGRLTIFRSVSRSLLDGDDELLGWGGLAAGGIEIQDVAGSHLDMLSEPNVRMLAEKLRACLDRVQEALQVGVDVAALLEGSTLRQPTGATRESKRRASTEAKTWSALVPIQPNGSRLPLFCIHALGPSLLFYRQLAAYLGPDQPFYAMQSPLESQSQAHEPSIEELASIYLKELQTFFPEGPYLLGGASLGGLIALEMCQQLNAQGKKPGLLILFDAAVPGCDDHVPAKEQASRHWQNLRSQGAAYLLQSIAAKSEYWRFRLHRSAQAAGCLCYHLVGHSLPASLRYLQVEEAHKRALARYTVQSYPGKITLMRAADVRETVGTRRNPTLGWETLAGGGLEIHDVPGGHTSMFEEPNVRTLAETLKAILPSSDSEFENDTASLVPGIGRQDRN
jgi:acyl transferase domain-containing protein/thioesterase domain-containing protein/acyl carrier protein